MALRNLTLDELDSAASRNLNHFILLGKLILPESSWIITTKKKYARVKMKTLRNIRFASFCAREYSWNSLDSSMIDSPPQDISAHITVTAQDMSLS